MKIDVFNHFSPAPYFEAFCRLKPQHPAATLFRRLPQLYDLDARLRVLDRFDDYQQLLCLANPPIEAIAPPQDSPHLARLANDALAATIKSNADRFPGFIAGLPMNNPSQAVVEARRAIVELGACGVQVFTNVNGIALSDPQFFDVFALLAELDKPILVHPIRLGDHPDYTSETSSQGEVWFTFGWPYETSACVARLVYSGLFDKLPTLKIITHHMGGMIPYFAEKITLGFEQIFFGTMERNPLAERCGLRHPPLSYFKLLYGDTATNGSLPATTCGYAFFGPERSLFATDAPFDPDGGMHLISRTMAAVDGLAIADDDKQRIFHANASALFGLPVRA